MQDFGLNHFPVGSTIPGCTDVRKKFHHQLVDLTKREDAVLNLLERVDAHSKAFAVQWLRNIVVLWGPR